MSDLRQANIDALGHLVAIRDELAHDGRKIAQHAAAFDPHHRDHDLVQDWVLIARAYLDKFNAAIERLDPNAKAAVLDAPTPAQDPDAATALLMATIAGLNEELDGYRAKEAAQAEMFPGVMLGENTSGVLLLGDELEAHRTQRIGRVAAHAREAITGRFTSEDASRRQSLHSQSLAAQSNAAPALTDGELEELHALDADHDWAVTTRDHADALVDALLAASDSAELEAVRLEEGWP